MNKQAKPEVAVSRVKITANGRMVLPKTLRDAVGISGDTELLLTIRDGRIQIATIADRVREAREIYRSAGDTRLHDRRFSGAT